MAEHAFRIGVLTLSDKGSRGEREDESGRLLGELVASLGTVNRYQVIADEEETIIMMLTKWSDDLALDLILTTGGRNIFNWYTCSNHFLGTSKGWFIRYFCKR